MRVLEWLRLTSVLPVVTLAFFSSAIIVVPVLSHENKVVPVFVAGIIAEGIVPPRVSAPVTSPEFVHVVNISHYVERSRPASDSNHTAAQASGVIK